MNHDYRVRVLDEVAIGDDGAPLAPRQRLVLALLVAAGPVGIPAGAMADAIWPSGPPGTWEASLRNTLAQVRKRLDGAIDNSTRHYTLTLPTESVDLWRFEALAEAPADVWDDNLALLETRVPFAAVELSDSLRFATDRFNEVRRQVLVRLASGGGAIDPRVLRILLEDVQRNEFDETLAYLAVSGLVAEGRVGDAREVLDEFADRFRAGMGRSVGAELRALRAELSQQHPFGESAGAEQPVRPAIVRAAMERRLSEHRQEQVVAAVDAVSAKPDPVALAVVVGPPGGGATRFGAGMAAEFHDRGALVLAPPTPPAPGEPFGPFSAAFADLRQAVARAPNVSADETSFGAMIMTRAVAAIESVAADRPLVLMIDDCHRLDSQSIRLLHLLLGTTIRGQLTLVLAGREPEPGSDWAQLVRRARDSDSSVITEVPPLATDEILPLIAAVWPDAPHHARRRLAGEIHRRSLGRPELVHGLIQGVDPYGYTLTEAGEPHHARFVDQIAGLDTTARTVLAAATVLGGEFHFAEAEAITEQPAKRLESRLLELLAEELLVDTNMPGRFAIPKAAIREAITVVTPAALLREMHVRAGELSQDVHQVAEHSFQAHTRLPADEVVTRLVRSAEAFLAAGALPEAARRFAQAESMPAEMAQSAQVSHAMVLEHLGAAPKAADVRRRAFERALADNRPADALAAATVGLPVAEPTNGDIERVDQLRRIKVQTLPTDLRFAHALHLSRQLSLLGRVISAQNWAETAAELASTPDEAADAAYNVWFSRLVSEHPDQRTRHLAGIDIDEVSRPVACRVLHTMVLDFFEIGDLDRAGDALAALNKAAQVEPEPLRIWHGALLAASLAFTRGRWGEAEELSVDAERLGNNYRIGPTAPGRASHLFISLERAGELSQFLALFDLAPPEITDTDAGRAAYATALFDVGRVDEAIAVAEPFLGGLLERPNYHVIAVVTAMARVAAAISDAELRSKARALMESRQQSAVMVGAGAACLGPADRALAYLVDDPEPLIAGIEFADRAGMGTWSVSLRAERARWTGDRALMAEAELLRADFDLPASVVGPPLT